MPRTSQRIPLAPAGGGRPFFNRILYEVSSTFLMPARTVWVTATGGGGGGGDNGGSPGLGGGSAETIWRRPITLSVGTSVAVTVGAAGAAGSAGGNGGDGGDSTFGAYLTALKGGGGEASGGAVGAKGASVNSTTAKNVLTDIDTLMKELFWGTAIMGTDGAGVNGGASFWEIQSTQGYGAGGLGKNIVPATAGRAGVVIIEW